MRRYTAKVIAAGLVEMHDNVEGRSDLLEDDEAVELAIELLAAALRNGVSMTAVIERLKAKTRSEDGQ